MPQQREDIAQRLRRTSGVIAIFEDTASVTERRPQPPMSRLAASSSGPE